MSKSQRIAAARRQSDPYPRLDDLFDRRALDRHLARTTLKVTTHPTLPLYLYCYTSLAVRRRAWDAVTTTSRGLVRDNRRRVVARGFQKFFAHGARSTSAVRATRFTDDWYATEKLDGTMISASNFDGQLVLSTKSAFDGPQLTAAREIWPAGALPEPGTTWLLEYLDPAHRIVVPYTHPELALLAVIDNWSGADRFDDEATVASRFGFRRPRRLELDDLASPSPEAVLASGPDDGSAEGFVLVWPRRNRPSGRLKLKYPAWIEAHADRFGLSSR